MDGAGEPVSKVSATAPGQTKIVYLIITHLEEDEASDLNWYGILYIKKIMKTLHLYLKHVLTGTVST